VFFIASIPEIGIHIILEGHLQEGHVFLDIWFINSSVEVLETQNDLILSHVRAMVRLRRSGPRAEVWRQFKEATISVPSKQSRTLQMLRF